MKKGYKAFYSSKVVRMYNNKLEDRLSYKKKNYNRLVQVHTVFIKNFFWDLLKHCPLKLATTTAKIIVYKFLQLITKYD